jgi:nucleotide-binding universal stress UspA family protein
VYRRILVAYDDSPAAHCALAAAAQWAVLTDAALTAVAVQPHLPHYGATVGEVAEEFALEEQACKRWLDAAASYATEHGLELATEMRVGNPAAQLLAAAREHHADLLVLGHPSHSAFWSRLLGATAERLAVAPTPCPVLIVPNTR